MASTRMRHLDALILAMTGAEDGSVGPHALQDRDGPVKGAIASGQLKLDRKSIRGVGGGARMVGVAGGRGRQNGLEPGQCTPDEIRTSSGDAPCE